MHDDTCLGSRYKDKGKSVYSNIKDEITHKPSKDQIKKKSQLPVPTGDLFVQDFKLCKLSELAFSTNM